MPDHLVIVPTYNERANIDDLVSRVMRQPSRFCLLVVDDASPDGTGQRVRELMPLYPNRLFLLPRQGKLGLGTAYVAGFLWGLERGFEFIFEMDADFSHNPDDLEKLLAACYAGADVAVGSRYVTGVNVVNWPMSRVLLSYFASWYVRLITRMTVRDATAGFVAYRHYVLRTLLKDTIRFTGYAFQIEMKFRAWKYGYRILEVPIIFTERVAGESKMNAGIVREAVWAVISLTVGSWFKRWRRPPIPSGATLPVLTAPALSAGTPHTVQS